MRFVDKKDPTRCRSAVVKQGKTLARCFYPEGHEDETGGRHTNGSSTWRNGGVHVRYLDREKGATIAYRTLVDVLLEDANEHEDAGRVMQAANARAAAQSLLSVPPWNGVPEVRPVLRVNSDTYRRLTVPQQMQADAIAEILRTGAVGAYQGSQSDARTDASYIVLAAQFASPLGDNHHNALKCPYCSPPDHVADPFVDQS